MVENYLTSSIWHLVYETRNGCLEKLNVIDPYLSVKINAIYDLRNIGEYYLRALALNLKNMPLTKTKINNIIRADTVYQWYMVRQLESILDLDIITLYANEWFNNGFNNTYYEYDKEDWIIGLIRRNKFKTRQEILIRMLAEYKKAKKQNNLKIINELFSECADEELKQAVLSIRQSSPAVKALLLTKAECLTEEDVLVGLKAMSNLKRQRGIDFKIKFQSLKNLGPKSRLDVMKQLLGTLDEYYVWKQSHPDPKPNQNNHYRSYWEARVERKLQKKSKAFNIPFETMPSREEVEQFLFSCVLKYNDEVIKVIKRFDDLKQKEKEDGISSEE